jgi:hypothetical protein
MKKVVLTLILVAVVMMMSLTTVNAATNADLIAYAQSSHVVSGQSISLTEANKVKVERYLTENPVTDEQADQIIAKANELVALMNEAGVSDPAKLSEADKTKFISIAQEGAAVAGLTLNFKAHSVEVYKDGTLVDTATLGSDTLAYTGNNVNVALVVSSIAVIALASAVVAKKRLANA